MKRTYLSAVTERLAALRGYLDELQDLGPDSLEQYQSDARLRRAAERLLQLVVESASDAGRMLLLGLGRNPGPSAAACFRNLAQHRVLPRPLAERLAQYAGLRNVVVHDYLALDDEMVWGQIQAAEDVFGPFVDHLRRKLESG